MLMCAGVCVCMCCVCMPVYVCVCVFVHARKYACNYVLRIHNEALDNKTIPNR